MATEQNNLTLVVLAGGLGSRFGGNKQITPLPKLERTIMELSIEDAFNAGIKQAVLIINKSVRAELEQTILPRLPKTMHITLIEQSIDMLPSEFKHLAEHRTKPWGTGHALLCAKPYVNGPAVVITADDYYGPNAYKQMVEHFSQSKDASSMAMVAFPIEKTLSEQGGVNRGICEVEQQSLKKVTETLNIHQTEYGLVGEIEGQLQSLDSHSLASMTFWGITPILMAKLENDFKKFLEAYDSDVKKEYYLPNCIQTCIESEHVSVRVYSAVDFWFGVTFKEELTSVAGKIYEHRQG
ncbi:nucleotidyltransferase family protein [Pseudoalteromonas sp. SS15]|uniref:nucleotidyltransferase family protein n=1 Tax=Pseudoalteromonas sp. SS15 TaxID=3139393 RepID=UPI003BAD7233